jgi:hypothetical protein
MVPAIALTVNIHVYNEQAFISGSVSHPEMLTVRRHRGTRKDKGSVS